MDQDRFSPQTNRGKTVHFIWQNLPRFILLCLIILIIIQFSVISKKQKAIIAEKMAVSSQKRPVVNTVIMPLAPTDIRDRIRLPGFIEPWQKLTLSAKVGGAISELFVREGTHVKEGEIIARIETEDYRIGLDRAKAAYHLAVNDYQRDKKLFDRGVTSKAQLEAKKAAVDTAKADMENADLQLSRCSIRAPFAGVINKIHVKKGFFLSVGDPIGELLQIDRVKAVIGIPESDVNAVRKLDQVEVTIKALDNRSETGKVHFLSSAPETYAALYRLELELNNLSRDILAGMFVSADVVKEVEHNVIGVPFFSVISRDNSQYVFVEKDGKAQKREVKTGIMEKWTVQITQGLQPDDRLIVEGHRDVEDGQEIKVVQVVNEIDR